MMVSGKKRAFVVVLLATLLSLAVGLLRLWWAHEDAAKWLASSGLLMTIAGIFQAEVSGWFQRVIDYYSDEEKYPYGPPSHINRQLTETWENDTLNRIDHFLFGEPRFAVWLIVAGTFVQVLAIWV